MSLQEYEDQFETRMANEIQVFSGALLRLDKHADKNEFMKNFILHLFKNVETSFITPKDAQQCLCQTITLSNSEIQNLARLL